jgi:putative oxidoreductase
MNGRENASSGRWSMLSEIASAPWTMSILLLVQRFAIAAVFFLSGRTKVEGWWMISDSAFELFRSEYRLPFIAPEAATYLAVAAEHVFPALLVLGLLTRLSAAALLAMTLIIQIFVYPDGWPTHLCWASILSPLLLFGGGAVSFDHWFGWTTKKNASSAPESS